MTKSISSVSELPSCPAVYAMFGGRGRGAYVAYIGIARSLRTRLEQHLVRRDSSVTTGVSAVSLNPEHVTEVHWWERPDFEKQDVLEAAELIAFDVLDPALRSRGNITERAKVLYADQTFKDAMIVVFNGGPSGKMTVPSLREAFDRIIALEERVSELENRNGSTE